MFCPKCKAEYVPGVIQCSDCQIPLVAELPIDKDEPIPRANLVSVIHVANEEEAVFYCEMLKRMGINATFRSLTIPAYDGITEATPYWGEVLVLDEDAESADQVVVDYLKTLDTQEKEEGV
ncbi:MAG: hypothetical protein ACE14V_11460 [bacterium]